MSNSQRIPISSRRLIQAHHTHTILTILHYCTYIRILLAGYHWTFQSKHQLMELSLVLRFGLGRIIHLEKYSATVIWGKFSAPKYDVCANQENPSILGFLGSKIGKNVEKNIFLSVRGVYGGVWETQI